MKDLLQKIKDALRRVAKRLSRRLNYVCRVSINDNSIYIPYIYGIRCKITEPWMIELLRMLLKEKEGAFLDVGVNVGQTLIKLKSLDINRKYIGFEPNPACVFYVNELIKKNKFPDCTILPVGLHTEDRVLSLNLFRDVKTDPSASLIENFRPSNRIIEKLYVPAFRFESLTKLLGFNSIAIIKIDVEGAEMEVINSLLEQIRAYRPIMLLEILPVRTEENVLRMERQRELENIINKINYTLYRVGKNGRAFSSLIRIDTIGIHSDINQCDYVLAPEELLLKY